MFIATGLYPGFRSFRCENRRRKIADAGNGGFAPKGLESKKDRPRYKHLAPNGAKGDYSVALPS